MTHLAVRGIPIPRAIVARHKEILLLTKKLRRL